MTVILGLPRPRREVDVFLLSKWLYLYGRQPVSIFEKLNDRQFKIHTQMRTGDLLAIRFFLLPADRCSSDRELKYLNFVLNVRRLANNTQRGLSTFFKNQVLVLFWHVHPY